MSNFIVFCESCDTEYKLVPMGDEFRDPPTVCSFCGSDLDKNNAVDSQEELDFDEEDEENNDAPTVVIDTSMDDQDLARRISMFRSSGLLLGHGLAHQ